MNPGENSKGERAEGRIYYPPQQYMVVYPMEKEKPLEDCIFDDPTYQYLMFDDRKIRHNFIAKVFGIMMVQLAITSLIAGTMKYYEPINRFVLSVRYIWIVALIVSFIIIISITCCEQARRKTPLNYILLFLFTITESVLIGMATIFLKTEIILLAVAVTVTVCLTLAIFALQTKWDFTTWGGGLQVALILLLIFGIIAILFPGRTMTMVYSCLGALIFSFYLIYDIQLMMGGKHNYSVSPEEYIFASLNLYLDVVNMFMYFLGILNNVE